MAFLFISYSRRDSGFVQYLSDALAERGREVWLDSNEIRAGAAWREAIEDAIDAADVFIPLLSPDWLSSQQCRTELEHAVEREKRILPLVRRDFSHGSVPEAVAAVTWLFFREQDDPDAALTALLEAVDTDPGWVREHSVVLERALEWERQLRDPSYLLRGSALERSEDWVAHTSDRSPQPTSLQLEYVVASRRAFGKERHKRRRGVFVSYRRDEAKGYAGRLYDRLSSLLGERDVFMDLGSIRPGVDFVSALREALDASGALIALIGPQWLDLREPDGSRRLDNPTDVVRLELEGALMRDITVVPLLVDGAKMPDTGELPPPLAELARREALELSHEQWKRDVDRLLSALPAEVRRGRSLFRSLRR